MPVLGENESESECWRGATQYAEACGLRIWDRFWAVGVVTGRPPSRCLRFAAVPRRSRPGISVHRLDIASHGIAGATQCAEACGLCDGTHFGALGLSQRSRRSDPVGRGSGVRCLHNAQTAAHWVAGIISSRLPGWKAPTD